VADQEAWFLVDRAELAAVRTGLLGGKRLGLLLQEGGEGSVGQSTGGGRGDLFEGGQVGLETGACFAEGVTGNNFSPLGCQVTDILEFLWS